MGSGVSAQAESSVSIHSSKPNDGDKPEKKDKSEKELKKEKKNKSEKELKKEKKNKNKSSPVVDRQSSETARDLMISYSHANTKEMKQLQESLEASGISVWVDIVGLKGGVDFLSKIGQAIIDAKLFVSLLSEASVKSKYCQDELALAYISSKSIFPVNIDPQEQLQPLLDTGMKLQLARFEWNQFVNPKEYEENFKSLLQKLKDEMERIKRETELEQNAPKGDKVGQFKRSNTRHNLNKSNKKSAAVLDDLLMEDPETYWKKRYVGDVCDWSKFVDQFMKQFKEPLDNTYKEEDQQWLMGILHREFEVNEDSKLEKAKFIEFCTVEGELFPLWSRVQDQALESYMMMEVFNMESSVRVEAIENLGKFRSLAVIDALRDLLTDPDYNVRAVAAISLAKTGANDKPTIKQLMKSLNDKDRLVREAGCLALGHLKVQEAIPKLINLWRNDFISSVREAAQVSLEKIGGDEVEKAMHVTKVLAEEIRMLTKLES